MYKDVIWKSVAGGIVSCNEKIKVMRQNLAEITQIAQDAYEDAILMEISPDQVKQELMLIMQNLYNPYVDSKLSKKDLDV